MSQKNNQIIAGIIFMLIWIFILVIWGNHKDIKADVIRDYETGSQTFGHPLWNN